METEWPSAEFHCSAYWSGRWPSSHYGAYSWGKALSVSCFNVSTGVCHQSQNPRSHGHARRETEAAVRGKQVFYTYPNLSFNLAMCLTKIFPSLSGHFHQGFQLSGLLQHEQWCGHSLGTQGKRRKKEMIHATAKTFTYKRRCLSLLFLLE